MSKHTPGPWRVTDANSGTYECRQIKSADGTSLMGDEKYYPWVPNDIEDWHLIAAAPELYAALSDLLAYVEDGIGDHESDEGAAAHTALKKARGEA